MKDALKNFASIRARVAKHGCVFMTDFDGTLSPIVRHPDDARMQPQTRALIRRIAQKFPVAVISGRSLADVMRRVGIRDIAYAGEHGRSWRIGTRRNKRAIPLRTARQLIAARKALVAVARAYPALIQENKASSVAFNYRALSPSHARSFRRLAKLAIHPFLLDGTIRLIDATRTFEIIADINWTKGECAKLMYASLNNPRVSKRIPIYIGDSETDEDAFKALRGGITIHVGLKKSSAAHYFLNRRYDVDTFIHALIS